ncbi:g7518 [Coccomyxa viridis]|uniref:Arp2/3 complex 34 kDa subunit n=1 Tax=Coccomyxa viridis TaxID=1274662 RepID=A0ABP1FY15_9CHLO
MKGPMAATIHEFEDCVYSVEHSSEAPECAVLSFSHRYELSAAAREHASKAYAGIAEVQVPAEASFQISLKVDLQRLRALPGAEAEAALERLASLRSVLLGLPIRQQLEHLAEGTSQEGLQAVHSRPGAPLWLHRQPDRLTAMFPVYLHGSDDDPLLSAFIQEFATAQPGQDASMAPQMDFTHPGEKPPIDIPVEAGKQRGSTFAGYVSMTVLPQHVGSAAKVERLAWVLLTLQAQLHASIKDFKASLHAHMRSSLDELLLDLEKARVDTVSSERLGAAHQARRALPVQPGKQSQLARLREKAQATPVKDMQSMLRTHKENRKPIRC